MLRLCLTGGPGAGKTEICNFLSQILEDRGFYIFFVSESASELILNGIRPSSHISLVEFQNFVLDKQLSKEKLYEELIKYYPEDKILIFYDRGIMDACAYVDKTPTFENMLKETPSISGYATQNVAIFLLQINNTLWNEQYKATYGGLSSKWYSGLRNDFSGGKNNEDVVRLR